ncbi:MAG: hypothetical protein ACXAEJ_01110 [Candidatus Thorarchaeota archaeon]|jgi:hypothetical protein
MQPGDDRYLATQVQGFSFGFIIKNLPETVSGKPIDPRGYRYPVHHYDGKEGNLIGHIGYSEINQRWMFKPTVQFPPMIPEPIDESYEALSDWIVERNKFTAAIERAIAKSVLQWIGPIPPTPRRDENFDCECGNNEFVDRIGKLARIDFSTRVVAYHGDYLSEVRRDPSMVWYCKECRKKHPQSQEILSVFDKWSTSYPFAKDFGPGIPLKRPEKRPLHLMSKVEREQELTKRVKSLNQTIPLYGSSNQSTKSGPVRIRDKPESYVTYMHYEQWLALIELGVVLDYTYMKNEDKYEFIITENTRKYVVTYTLPISLKLIVSELHKNSRAIAGEVLVW